jgi:hypothetical protein
MSQRKVQDTILYLEKRGLVQRLRAILGGPSKGNVYQVLIPAADMAPGTRSAGNTNVAEDATTAPYATLARRASPAPDATNKDDDDYQIQSSSKGGNAAFKRGPVENHNRAAAPREKRTIDDGAFELVRDAYERITGNAWIKSDSVAYKENCLKIIPAGKIISVLETVTARTPTKINSLKYFLKEILALPDGRNRAWQKKQLENIIVRIRDCSIGRPEYSGVDLLEDVKCACVREGVIFNDDIYNELAR